MPCVLGTSVEAHVCSLVYSTDDVVRSVDYNGDRQRRQRQQLDTTVTMTNDDDG